MGVPKVKHVRASVVRGGGDCHDVPPGVPVTAGEHEATRWGFRMSLARLDSCLETETEARGGRPG